MTGVFYRVVFDISCYYALAAFFFHYTIGYEVNPVSFVILLTSALVLGISEELGKNRRVVAFASLAIPAIGWILESDSHGRIVLLLPWVYMIVLVVRESYISYYYQFETRFKLFLWVWVVPAVFAITHLETGVPALEEAVPYLLVFLMAGVMMLQILRYRAATESRRKFEKYQIVQTISFFGVCFVFFATGLTERLYQYVILPAKDFLLLIVKNVFLALFDRGIRIEPVNRTDFEKFREELANAEGAEISVQGNEWAEMIAELAPPPETTDMTSTWVTLGAVLGIIVLLILLGNHGHKVKVAALDVEREELEGERPEEQKIKKRSRHPDLVVRYYYREFMKKAETRTIQVQDSDTTAEIAEKYKKKNHAKPENAEEITKIYRKVRYSKESVTREDAAKIKSLVKGA